MEDKEVPSSSMFMGDRMFVPDEINILNMTSRTLDDKIPPGRKTFSIK